VTPSRPNPFVARIVLLLLAMIAAAAGSSASWLSDATGINIDLNREVGTGIAAMSGPTLERAEATGRKLINEADAAIKNRIDQADLVAQQNIARVDTVLEKRLLQIDEISARRIDQVDAVLAANIVRVDETAQRTIADLDQRVGQRLVDVDGMMQGAIADLDDRLQARIEQVDELAERRIGTLDTLSTKATLTFEDTFRRLLLAGCLLVFLTAAAWRLWAVAVPAWLELKRHNATRKMSALARRTWRPLAAQIGAALLAVAAIYGLYLAIPNSPTRRAAEMRAEYEGAFAEHLERLELREARYYAAQLRLLAPGDPSGGARLRKAELLRDVLDRPLLADKAAIRTLEMRVRAIERDTDRHDPDVLALMAMITWRSGTDRRAELAAAVLATRAIEESTGPFPMLPVAASYLGNYLRNPIPALAIAAAELQPSRQHDQMQAALERAETVLAERPEVAEIFATTTGYNALVGELLASSQAQYPELVRARARGRAQEAAAAAQRLMAAWRDFDARFDDEAIGAGASPVHLAAFELADAEYVRACWYVDRDPGEVLPSVTRLAAADTRRAGLCAPPRVFWAKRHMTSLSRETALLSALGEARRFDDSDQQLRELELEATRFYAELDSQRRIDHLLASGQRTAVAFARAGYSQAAMEVLETVQQSVGAGFQARLKDIEAEVAKALLAGRSPLV
jgi:hypothetical protein